MESRGVEVCIGLGSNLGEREELLRFAVAELGGSPGIELLAVSSLYETAPVGPGEQGPYLNAALRLRTSHAPRALLERCLEIETAAGRVRDGTRWGPRRLDLDLLLFGDAMVEEEGLLVPHPRMTERAFVLEPLAEVAADWVHPMLGYSIREMAEALRDPASDAVRRLEGEWSEAPAK